MQFDPKEYQRALELGVVLSSYVRVMFVGPGGVGKSSLLLGLMNKTLSLASSTQLAETLTVKADSRELNDTLLSDSTSTDFTSTDAVTTRASSVIKPATTSWAMASEDCQSFWREVTDKDEVMEIVGIVNLVANASKDKVDSSRLPQIDAGSLLRTISSDSIAHVQLTHDGSQHVISIQQRVVNDILMKVKENPGVRAPEKEVLIRVWDCGGQSVFLEVLPAFLTPRTMFLLMFDASRGLTDKCLIRSFHRGEVINQQEHSSSTLELLLEWMASIHSMLGPTPRILPVGTHGDRLSAETSSIIDQLNLETNGKAFAHLLRTCVVVDNTKAGLGRNEDPGFEIIRKEIHKFASKHLEVRTPVAWVLFRRVFQIIVKESNAPIVSYQTVKDIAMQCKIPLTAVSTVIRFYHDLAVFFHYAEVPGLQHYIVADPQWLIGQFAKILALEGFESYGNSQLWSYLRDRGILLEPLYTEVWKEIPNNLKPQVLIDLLVHFLLAAPINETSKVTNIKGKEYFISCVLPAYSSDQKQTRSQQCVIKQAAPLHLLFNTYYVPPGFFSRLVTTLINRKRFRVSFGKGVYRDRITLFYGTAHCEIDEVRLTKCQSSVKIEIYRTEQRTQQYRPFSLVCREILDFITTSFLDILHWLKGIEIDHAFVCHSCPEEVDANKNHYIRIPRDITVDTIVRCDKDKIVDLTINHRYWLKFSRDSVSNSVGYSIISICNMFIFSLLHLSVLLTLKTKTYSKLVI